ncbi:MAG: glycine cleavage system aminomethyltransferase GcvT [Ignavibacteria bacterium]|nr:glycine cleavage system aminomethyltransferase GcvT [Ignavibacteria bacterium]
MKQTKLYNIHKALGAKIVEFAGFSMPIQYNSIIAEHKAVRESAGLFDVSHMGEIFVRGNNALKFIQNITINDASKLLPGKIQYSAMCLPDGGIVDDLLVYMIEESEYMIVVNASNKDKDFDWMKKNNQSAAEITDCSDEYSLLALQGPQSKTILQKICNRELNLEYYNFFMAKVADEEVLVSRTGYTGELGYELYFKGNEATAEKIWNTLMKAGKDEGLVPAGLAARDSLRLEMGFSLYGNDIDNTTNPIEAGLGWITKLNKPSFIGKEALQQFKSKGTSRKLSGIITKEKCFPRKGYAVTCNGKKIGEVTSGTVSPVLEEPIALAYVESQYSEIGTKVNFLIREKEIPATICKYPFIKK